MNSLSISERCNAHLLSMSEHLDVVATEMRQSEKCLDSLEDGRDANRIALTRTRATIEDSRALLARTEATLSRYRSGT